MKIVSVCKVYPTQRPGGMGFVCQDRARQLVKEGHEVHVLTTGRKTHRGETLDDQGVEVHHMPCKPMHYSDEFAQHCESHCKGFLPQILHCDSLDVSRPWWKGIRIERKAVTLHGFSWGAHFTQWNLFWRGELKTPPPLNSGGLARERNLISQFDVAIGISLSEHWQLKDLMAIPNSRLVYNPIAEYFFEPRIRLRNDSLRFLCSAVSGADNRGFHLAEQAAKLANVELVIARDLPREQLPELIDSCHGLVLPTSYAQGCDLAVAEAAVRGCPIIVTATGSYLRESEKGGIYYGVSKLVPLNDLNALVQAMSVHPLEWYDSRYTRAALHHPKTHTENWLKAILG